MLTRRTLLGGTAAALAAPVGMAFAQAYPNRVIKADTEKWTLIVQALGLNAE